MEDYSKIVETLRECEPTTVIFSNKKGRIFVGSKNLTGAPGISGGPEVFFLVEKWDNLYETKEKKTSYSLREALWRLGIVPTEQDET